MICVNDFKVGDNVVLRDGTTATIEEINQYSNDFGLGLSCFSGRLLYCYANGGQRSFGHTTSDIVQHIPTQSIDVNKIKVGDTVTFRNGKTQTVQKIEPTSVELISSTTLRIVTDTQDGWFGMFGDTNGYRHSPQHPSDWDIVQHIPVEEDIMIDVFKIKQGDTVKFRNGEVHTVTEATVYEKAGKHAELWIERYGKEDCFTYGDNGGSYYSNDTQAGWDIVEHIPNQGEEEPVKEEPAQDEMTMRDQFAMSALNGLLIGTNNWRGTSPEELSEVSYALADAMMKSRKENA